MTARALVSSLQSFLALHKSLCGLDDQAAAAFASGSELDAPVYEGCFRIITAAAAAAASYFAYCFAVLFQHPSTGGLIARIYAAGGDSVEAIGGGVCRTTVAMQV
jgi:hypothetical protein